MFLARSSRKKKRKELLTHSTSSQVSSPESASERLNADDQEIIGQIPPTIPALEVVTKYWSLRPKGLSFFGIKIDRKMVYSSNFIFGIPFKI